MILIFHNSLERIIKYILTFKDDFKEQLVFNGEKLLKTSLRNIKIAILGSESEFIRAVIKEIREEYLCHDLTKKIGRINLELSKDSIHFDAQADGFVKFGAFAEIKEIVVDGEKRIEKKLIRHQNKSDFEREKQIMGALSDKSLPVVNVFKDTLDEGQNYFHMENMDFDLCSYLKSEILSESIRYSIIIQLINIAETLFKHKILHRDLHPGNFLLVAHKASEPLIKITDFGLAEYSYNQFDESSREYYGNKNYTHACVLRNLSKANYSTEVYSISRLINLVLTGNPNNANHCYKGIYIKAKTLQYGNIVEFKSDFEQTRYST